MTTPIMNVLDIAQQPPFVVGWQELEKFHRAITALYEQQTKADREAFLLDDCMSLILMHKMFGGTPKAKIQIIERNEQIQGSIEEIARMLLSVADSLNTRLPESFVEQCRNSTNESTNRFYEIIREAYFTPAWKMQNKPDGDTRGTGMGNGAPTASETPPAAKETPKVAVLQPYTPKPVGRPKAKFEKAIADTYKDKTDIIQEHTGTALASMTDPKAVIALFVVYLQKGILKKCPTYWQTLRLLGIEAEENTDKEKLCPFGMHQQYDKQRKMYFDENDSYKSLNDTDSKQKDEISSFIQDATTIYNELLAKLIQEPTEQARQGA